MTQDDQAYRWTVSGRVQGVGFRWFIIQVAQKLGLGGWVSNLPGGQVEVIARGPATDLEALEQEIRRGPKWAHVDSVEKLPIPHETVDRNSFGIK